MVRRARAQAEVESGVMRGHENKRRLGGGGRQWLHMGGFAAD